MLRNANTGEKLVLASDAPAAATAAVVTLAATTGQMWVIRAIHFSYDAAPAAGSLIITENGTPKYTLYITAAGAGPVPLPDNGMQFASGAEVVVTLASGAGTVKGALNVWSQ